MRETILRLGKLYHETLTAKKPIKMTEGKQYCINEYLASIKKPKEEPVVKKKKRF